MTDLNIREWAKKNPPKDNMIYKNAFYNWVSFVEESVLPMMFNDLIRNLDYEDAIAVINNHHSVVGVHMSKSIVLPVVEVKIGSCRIVFRYNFYDTELTVISPFKPIDLNGFEDMFRSDSDTVFYHQGVKEDSIVDSKYTDDKKKFTMRICGNYNVFTIMACIRNSINRSLTGSTK